jgi:uncharacterized membrane protein
MKRLLRGLVALGLLVGGAGRLQAQPSYIYNTIIPPGSGYTVAADINDAGQIVGSYFDGLRYHGYLLSANGYTTLAPPGSGDSGAFGINAAGQIVGFYTAGARGTLGFLLSNGSHTTVVVGSFSVDSER